MRPLKAVVIGQGRALMESGLKIPVSRNLEIGQKLLVGWDYTENRPANIEREEEISTEDKEIHEMSPPPEHYEEDF